MTKNNLQSLAKVTFGLGRFVDLRGQGIEVDSKKMDAVKRFPRPLSPINIRSFLDLSRYYRRFVEGFSFIASLLTVLTKRRLSLYGLKCVKRVFN